MKTPILLTRAGLLGLALCLIAPAALRAEGSDKPEKKAEKSEKAAEKPVPPGILKKYDKDGDGKLSDDEAAAWKADKQAKAEAEKKAMLEKYDADKDGKLSEEERAAMKADREKAMQEKKEKAEKAKAEKAEKKDKKDKKGDES